MSLREPEQDSLLVRAIGTKALSLGIFNAVVGGGIFVLPGLVAFHLGPAAIFAYLVCALGVGMVFLCYAEIGTRVTRSGGSYAYIEEAFGPMAGFVCTVVLWFGWTVLSDAAITAAMVDTLAIAFPILGGTMPRSIFIVVVIAFLAVMNIRGVQSGVKLFVFNTIVKLAPLMLLLAVGLFFVSGANLRITEWPDLSSIGSAAVLLFFAFAGAEVALSASGEIRNPLRTVPFGLLFGFLGILSLYVGLQVVSQGTLGPGLADQTDAPLAAAARVVFGEWGARMLIAGGVISIFSTLSGEILGAPRVIYASAQDGNLPAILARTHPEHHTPHVAIVVTAVAIGGFAMSGGFESLALVASGAILLVYLFVSLAVVRLRRRDGLPKEGQFRLPFGYLVPMMSMLLIGWLLSRLTREEAIAIAVMVGAAILAYGLKWAVQRRTADGRDARDSRR